MSNNIEQRLEALYAELADVRLAMHNAWVQGTAHPDDKEHGSFMDEIRDLEREEDELVEQIESLGGEDPDL